MQPDGKIIVLGSSQTSISSSSLALARYNPDGSLDNSFDGDGKLTTAPAFSGGGTEIALQEDGKIVAAGVSEDPGGDFTLVRFFPDGKPDLDFGEAGSVRTDWGGLESPQGIALQPNGKIVVAGLVTIHGDGYSIVLARYNPDGSLDPTFGYYGQVLTDISYQDFTYALALQRDGKIVLAGSFSSGYGYGGFALLRYK
jgi:uncharacterized delta-60 repeat protein